MRNTQAVYQVDEVIGSPAKAAILLNENGDRLKGLVSVSRLIPVNSEDLSGAGHTCPRDGGVLCFFVMIIID